MDKGLFEIKSKIDKGDLPGKYSNSWIEDSFDFEKPIGKQISLSQTKNYLGTSITNKKILWLSIIMIVGLVIIFGRIIYLQVIRGDYYRSLAEGNRIRLEPIPSQRGIIFDRNRNELVQNVPEFSLAMVPQDLPKDSAQRETVIDDTVKLSGVSKTQITDLLKKYGSYSYASLVIKENLDYETALKLYIASAQLPGIVVEKGSKRKYAINNDLSTPTSSLSLSHLLGYLGKINDDELTAFKDKDYLLFDNIGKTGLEKTYESALRGAYGVEQVEVDALGHEQNVLAENSPEPGKNLILAIDAEAQVKMENLIKATLKKIGKGGAIGIAMDPRDGSILAMVSWPSFDNNEFSGGISVDNYNRYLNNPNDPLFNRAIAGTYPSGSTVKLIIAAAALQEKIITPNTAFLSTGGIQVGQWFFRDWLAGGHGVTNVTKALAWSINTFFYYIGGGYKNFVGLGVDRLVQYMKSFNLAKQTGIDLPGEASGFLPSKEWKLNTKGESWYIGDTYNLSIGQGDLLVTPLQMAVWTSAVANGGTVVQPHLVNKIEDPVTGQTTVLTFARTSTMISDSNLAVVRQGMRDCVTYGSCKMLQSLPFLAAGKTGTAQWNSTKDNHAWFTSFAPLDHPQIVVTVMIEEGKEGSTISEPIARDFLAWWGAKYLK
ncbi:MAG: penicillin-binding protein 2 [Patescibacteria group bacterium]